MLLVRFGPCGKESSPGETGELLLDGWESGREGDAEVADAIAPDSCGTPGIMVLPCCPFAGGKLG